MNWGKGITVAIIFFMSYIMFMVVTMIRTSSDLVEEDYYEEGIKFEKKIQAIKNSVSIKDDIEILVDDEYVTINFPSSVKMENITEGLIHFYRPDNGNLDRHFSFSNRTDSKQVILKNKIVNGYYNVLLSWKTKESDFYVEKNRIKIE